MPELMSRVAELARRTEARRLAPVGEEFTGPVLVEGQASGELLRQTLVPLVLARRAPDGDAPRFAQNQGPTTPFLARIGLRVLSDSFSVTDTPSLKEFDGRPVAGAYLADDEGVPAKDVTLVDKGRLLTLLTSRTPLKNLPQSNGHGRNGSVQPGVLQVRSTQAIPASELKTKYLELLKAQDKAFGYIVRAIAGPGEVAGGQGGPIILDAVKVTPDGTEEPVRGLRFGDVPSTAFRDILEASEELHAAQLPDQRDRLGFGDRAQPDFRGARDSAHEGDRPEAAGGAFSSGTVGSGLRALGFRLSSRTPTTSNAELAEHAEQVFSAGSAVSALIVVTAAERAGPTCPSGTRRRRAPRFGPRQSPRRSATGRAACRRR